MTDRVRIPAVAVRTPSPRVRVEDLPDILVETPYGRSRDGHIHVKDLSEARLIEPGIEFPLSFLGEVVSSSPPPGVKSLWTGDRIVTKQSTALLSGMLSFYLRSRRIGGRYSVRILSKDSTTTRASLFEASSKILGQAGEISCIRVPFSFTSSSLLVSFGASLFLEIDIEAYFWGSELIVAQVAAR